MWTRVAAGARGEDGDVDPAVGVVDVGDGLALRRGGGGAHRAVVERAPLGLVAHPAAPHDGILAGPTERGDVHAAGRVVVDPAVEDDVVAAGLADDVGAARSAYRAVQRRGRHQRAVRLGVRAGQRRRGGVAGLVAVAAVAAERVEQHVARRRPW